MMFEQLHHTETSRPGFDEYPDDVVKILCFDRRVVWFVAQCPTRFLPSVEFVEGGLFWLFEKVVAFQNNMESNFS